MKNKKTMDVRYLLIGWKKQQIFLAAGLLFIVILVVFVSLNVGAGPSKTVIGKVKVVGLDTSTRYELPMPIITVELKNGKTIIVDGVRGLNLNVGDNVELFESKRLFTSGFEYKLQRAN